MGAIGKRSQGWVRPRDGVVKQAVSGATRGRHSGDDGVRREGSGVVEADGGVLMNFSGLTASIVKSSSF
jgi:hypothetical protein